MSTAIIRFFYYQDQDADYKARRQFEEKWWNNHFKDEAIYLHLRLSTLEKLLKHYTEV